MKPIVSIRLFPATPVAENTNVTVKCEKTLSDSELLSVQWYLNGEILKSVNRNCHSHPNCKIDTTQILLINVKRNFKGNYSCRGRNRAGWGEISESVELFIYYRPQRALLKHEPEIIRKGYPFKVKYSHNLAKIFS